MDRFAVLRESRPVRKAASRACRLNSESYFIGLLRLARFQLDSPNCVHSIETYCLIRTGGNHPHNLLRTPYLLCVSSRLRELRGFFTAVASRTLQVLNA
jgi:hypothetical protein